jgi:DNA polymerase I-like protein with 3'-5' exonuclease and polymerase domains
LAVWWIGGNVPEPTTLSSNLAALAAALQIHTTAVIDFETSGVKTYLDQIAGVGFYLPQSAESFYINIGHATVDSRFPKYSEEELIQAISLFFGDPSRLLIAHNATFELRFLMRLGLIVRCRVSCSLIHTHRTDENLRDRGREQVSHYHTDVSYGLKQLTVIYFNKRPPTILAATGGSITNHAPILQVAKYCVLDCYNTWQLYHRARQIIDADEFLPWLADNIDDPNMVVLAKMMAEGILIDVTEAESQVIAHNQAIQQCRLAIWNLTQTTWPLETPSNVLRVLRHLNIGVEIGYDPFYVPMFEWERDPSTAREVLIETLEQSTNEIHRQVLALFISKGLMEQRLSSFLKPLPQKVTLTNGRLYPDNFASTLVTTRFTCSPSLQNLPRKMGDDGDVDEDIEWMTTIPENCRPSSTTKDIFVAKEGHTLVVMDLSAAEPRYLAMLFQRAVINHDEDYQERREALKQWRQNAYGPLIQRMKATAKPLDPSNVGHEEINWPEYADGLDPLYKVFLLGLPTNDPYNALLIGMDPQGYANASQTNTLNEWFQNERWRGKRAFLALGYGSTADNLYRPLGWTLDQTRTAIKNLEATYATLNPLRELTLQEIKHTGEVRTLWGRPRRINGYYQLARPEPLTIGFYRKIGDKWQDYEADIIPLGTTRHAVQAFVHRAYRVIDNGKRGEIILSGDPASGGLTHKSVWDPFANADHFNNPPFRNISFSQIKWVRDVNGLTRPLARQARVQRQALNSMCQGTGADHLRWLMNNMDHLCHHPWYQDCQLILTVHDSLIYEVPDGKVEGFIQMARPIMQTPPPWCTININVGIETGKKYGDMTKIPANI